MAREELSLQKVTRSGMDPAYTQVTNVDGYKFQNDQRTIIHVMNGYTATVTVSVDVPGTVDGQTVDDRSVSIPASEDKMIGPFQTNIYNHSDGMVYVDFDVQDTNITAAVIRV